LGEKAKEVTDEKEVGVMENQLIMPEEETPPMNYGIQDGSDNEDGDVEDAPEFFDNPPSPIVGSPTQEDKSE
jgi:inorganic pyrophosphatase